MTVNFRDDRGESPSFQIPTAYSINDGIAVPRAYQGHSQGSNYRFFTVEIPNKLKSDKAGYEVRDTVEMVEFKNDSKCSPAHRIDASLFSMHPEILSDYAKWKEGVASGVTEIKDWDVLSTIEMGLLISRGFTSVEHIANTPDNELMVLGIGWKDYKIKAAQHMKRKQIERDGIAENAEKSAMQKELDELRAMVLALSPKQEKVTLDEKEEEVKEEVKLEAKEEVEVKKVIAPKKAVATKRKVGIQE